MGSSRLSEGRLLVVGAGTMGQQIALQAALQGVEVGLSDIAATQLDRARQEMKKLLDRRVQTGKLGAGDAATVLQRVHFTTDLAEAARGARWAIEAVVERLDVKRSVFEQLAQVLPNDTGLATNSSHIRAATVEMLRPLVAVGRLGRKTQAGFYDYRVDPPQPLALESDGAQRAAVNE